ncbi:MAG: DUF4373 domain-containing protein [Oscillospiraceae bacterium]|nr:DUF4373 domain-containing protein [Oscillospiraceae bacterium]
MAQIKRGLDYYAHNVGMTADRRLIGIRREYGSVGIDVLFALYDMIYSHTGYYLEYNSRTRSDVLWELGGIVRGKNSPEDSVIAEIIEAFVVAGLFDRELYSKGILTSAQVQEQYYMSTLRRRRVEVRRDVWILSEEQMKTLYDKSPILEYLSKSEDVSNMSTSCQQDVSIMSADCTQNVNILPQSKGKKIEKKEKNIESIAEQTAPSGGVGCADLHACADKDISCVDKSGFSSGNECASAEKTDAPADMADAPDKTDITADMTAIPDKKEPPDTEKLSTESSSDVEKKPESTSGRNKRYSPEEMEQNIRDELMSIYGKAIVTQYEQKFLRWVQKTGAKRAEMYPQIQKWLLQDIGNPCVTTSDMPKESFEMSSVDVTSAMEDILNKYRLTDI